MNVLITSPVQSLLSLPRRVPRVLFEEYEPEIVTESILAIPDVEQLNPASFLCEINSSKNETLLTCKHISLPQILTASSAPINLAKPGGRGNGTADNVDDGLGAYQPISSSSECTSDTSNDASNPTASTSALDLHSIASITTTVSSTTAVTTTTTTTGLKASSSSSSRRRKGSSPKKRVFDDIGKILDLSARSSGVDE